MDRLERVRKKLLVCEAVAKVWSDAARQAAAEAHRSKGGFRNLRVRQARQGARLSRLRQPGPDRPYADKHTGPIGTDMWAEEMTRRHGLAWVRRNINKRRR